ncbi:tRNA (cytidine(34)-2'-O)-methyltransferase [Rhodopirellula sp. MGV]|uniref:tRNA (cytidine(34)-2'-O)-methyltransferase n=1 Tax=Rhodopirellula sp. MGV TaxID=2023130 RepID=UPI000B97C6E8|nr:tRNA (cytidine(34)-2'-O)-methyltransferase [Rhodopirellula sp. MGV]OYP28294.1 SpoU protein [Rhodopirellula sp. MGV]PNY38828.1 tRNA (cytidine(34)-2'-O)-methyltransferase [Rhodopirellula baltica]
MPDEATPDPVIQPPISEGSPSEPPAAREVETVSADRANPVAHVVLYQPEIPPNTGNIGRSCVAVGAKLWIVRPAAFDYSEKRVRRAGLDYWQHLDFDDAENWGELVQKLPATNIYFFSRFAERTIWDVEFQHGDCFVFGSESKGLPREIVQPGNPQALRLPTTKVVRSLNLATTAGIVLFEQQRQLHQRAQQAGNS